jgi:hypothetical protein
MVKKVAKASRASRKAKAWALANVALPMRPQVANAVVDPGSPSNNGAALVALPYGHQVANAIIVSSCYTSKEASIYPEAD